VVWLNLDYNLLLKLVSINTTSTQREGYNEITNVIEDEAKKVGLLAEKIFDDKGIPHVLISMPNASKGSKKVIFLTHYDVVPVGEGWNFDPFKPFIKDGKLFGRGAADDKSNIAAAIAAFSEALEEKVKLKVNPFLVVVGGEETGESKEFLQTLEGDLCVVLDVGCESLSIGASGRVKLIVNVKGEQAHSAYPFKGKNAIYKATKIIRFLEELGEKFEKTVISRFPASTYYERLPRRMNITMIKGGVAENIIPGECRLIVDIRTIPEESAEKVAEEVKNKLDSFAREKKLNIDVQVKSFSNGWFTNKKEVIDKIKRVLEDVTRKPVKVVVELGGTDGRYLIKKMPVVQYGTIREDTNFHSKNEFVYLEDVKTVKRFIKKILTVKF